MELELEDVTRVTRDPVGQLLLRGKAGTLREAEELYLDSCLPEVVRLLQSELSDDELGAPPAHADAQGTRQPGMGGGD